MLHHRLRQLIGTVSRGQNTGAAHATHPKPIASALGAAAKTALRWTGAVLGAAAGIAGVYALVVYLRQRQEESEGLLRGVEEELVFRDIDSSLEPAELRSLKERIDEAFQKDPRSARGWALGGIYQAYISFHVERYKIGSLNACARARDLDQNEPLADLCAGMASYSANELISADDHLRKALYRQPSWSLAWYYHGRVLTDLKRPREAEQALRKARALAPDRPGFGLEVARFYLSHDNPLSALVTAREVAESTDAAAPRNALGLILYALGDTDKAIDQLAMAIQAAPDRSLYLTNMAALLNVQERYAEALPLTVKARGLEPDSPHALVETVMALAGQKKYSLALPYSERLITLVRNVRWVRTNHDYLRGQLSENGFVGAFVFFPPGISACENWTLSRFADPEFKDWSPRLASNGKFVYPPEIAGQPAPPGGVPLDRQGNAKLTLSCSGSRGPAIDPEWLTDQWQKKSVQSHSGPS